MQKLYNYIRDMIAKKKLNIKYIFIHDMATNPFTNHIPKDILH